jgi:hypothetical protein
MAFAFAVLVARISHSVEDKLLADLLTSAERFDPSVALQLRNVQNDQRAFQNALHAALARAAQRAQDAAVLDFASTQQRIVTPTSADDLSRCAGAAGGSTSSVANFSAKDQRDLVKAATNVFRSAVDNGSEKSYANEDRAQALLASIYVRIDPEGKLDDQSRAASLSDNERCQMYLGLMRGIRALPEADAALVFRYMMKASD